MLLLFQQNLTSMSESLLAYAQQKASEGEFAFAVVLAHAACEWHTEEALYHLIRHRGAQVLGDAVMSLVGNTISLDDSRVRKVYQALTDDYPGGHDDLGRQRAPWWDAWQVGRKLRHNVAHNGARVTSEQATSAIDSVVAYIAHVTGVVERVRAA
jgi:hypothetical protein